MAESIKKFIIRDKHGATKEQGSFSVVGGVQVELVPGYGEPYAESEYVDGILTITIHNIEGNGITDITTDSQEGDEAVNTVTIKTNDNQEGVVMEIRNGSRGAQGPQGIQGPQGPQGNSGYTGAVGELEVVNNLTDGGEEAALSAEMGKELKQDISDQSTKDTGLQIRYCQFIAVDEAASTGLACDCVKISGILNASTGEITGAGTAKRWVLDIDLSKRDWSLISGFYSNVNFAWGYFDSTGAWVNKTGTNPVAIPRGATRFRYGIHSDWESYPILNGYYRSIILYDTSERLIHSDLSEVTIDSLNWCKGYLNTSGKLVSSSLATSKARYSQPFLLTKGRTVKVTGSESRLALATKDRVNINDTFTLVGTTYTANEDVLMIVSINFAIAYTFAVTPSSLPVRVTNIEEQLANDSAMATTMDAYNPEKKYIIPALRAKGKPSETVNGGTKASLDYYPCVMVVTDLHAEVKTGISNPPSSWWPAIDRAIGYSQDNDIDAVLSLGDNFNGMVTTLRDKAIAASKPVLMIVGNHDAFFGATIISKTNVMSTYYSSAYVDKQSTLTSNNYHQEDGKPYWYVDLPARDGSSAKLRIISIMEYEHVYSDGATASNTDRISKAQYDWLASVLTSCDVNTHVVIAKHQPMLLDSTICEAWNALSPFGYSGNNNNADSRFSGCIAKIVDAWIHGTSVDVTIGGETVTYSFASSHLANFGCYIVGHAHLDACNYVKDYPEQVCVTFCNACPNPFQSWSDLPRTISGKLYDCVTVFSYDWNNRIVKLLRIGPDTTIDGRQRKYVTFKLPNITA